MNEDDVFRGDMFIWTLTETEQAQPAVAHLPHFVGGKLTARPCRTCAVRARARYIMANDIIAAIDGTAHHCEAPVCRLEMYIAPVKGREYCFVLYKAVWDRNSVMGGPWRSLKLKITPEGESLRVFLIVHELHNVLST
jgi:hypothetical protein